MGAVRWATGAAAAVLVLTACTPGTRAADPPAASRTPTAPTAGPGRSPSSAPLPPSPAASAPATAAPQATTADQRLVTVTRSGGFSGAEHKSVLVAGDGSYRRLDHGRQTGAGRLTAAQLARLRAALTAADFPHLPRVSVDPDVFDAFVFAFVHDGREIAVQETVLPPGLARVLAALPDF